jgi:hypothetical protein
MSTIPLHLQVLKAMRRRLEARRRELEGRVGKGMPDQDYQRYVGRIAETQVGIDLVEQLMAGGMNVIEDEEQTEREQRRTQRAEDRRARGN